MHNCIVGIGFQQNITEEKMEKLSQGMPAIYKYMWYSFPDYSLNTILLIFNFICVA